MVCVVSESLFAGTVRFMARIVGQPDPTINS
jgi:hypothetical protein